MNRTALFFQSMILASLLLFGFLAGYVVGWNSAVKTARDIGSKNEQSGSQEDFDQVASQMQGSGAANWEAVDPSLVSGAAPLAGHALQSQDDPGLSPDSAAKIPDLPFPDSTWSKASSQPLKESVDIVLKDDGSILYGPEPETLLLVNDKIKVEGTTKPLERVVIRPERRARYQDVVAILHACEDAHLTQVTFGPAL